MESSIAWVYSFDSDVDRTTVGVPSGIGGATGTDAPSTLESRRSLLEGRWLLAIALLAGTEVLLDVLGSVAFVFLFLDALFGDAIPCWWVGNCGRSVLERGRPCVLVVAWVSASPGGSADCCNADNIRGKVQLHSVGKSSE